MDLAHFHLVVQDVRSIGYPTYVLYIGGVWKILAAGALLWRRLPRLREWAYAGVFFEMSGAVASHVLVGNPMGKYAAPLAFTLSHVGVLVVPAGPGTALDSPIGELTLWVAFPVLSGKAEKDSPRGDKPIAQLVVVGLSPTRPIDASSPPLGVNVSDWIIGEE